MAEGCGITGLPQLKINIYDIEEKLLTDKQIIRNIKLHFVFCFFNPKRQMANQWPKLFAFAICGKQRRSDGCGRGFATRLK